MAQAPERGRGAVVWQFGIRLGHRWRIPERMGRRWADFGDRVAAWSLAGMTLLCSLGLTRGALPLGVLPGLAVIIGLTLVVGLACIRLRPRSPVLGWAQRVASLLCVSTVCLTAVIQARRGVDHLVQMGGTAAVVVAMSAVLAVVLPRVWPLVSHMLAVATSVITGGEKP